MGGKPQLPTQLSQIRGLRLRERTAFLGATGRNFPIGDDTDGRPTLFSDSGFLLLLVDDGIFFVWAFWHPGLLDDCATIIAEPQSSFSVHATFK